MLETLWYMMVLVMQVLQTNPHVQADKIQIDVFVASKNAYSFVVKGNAVQGQVMDAGTHVIFGEFESTRRLPQAYVIFPRVALPAELEAAATASQDKGKAAAPNANAAKDNKSGSTATVPATFTIDYTKALKQLRPFSAKPRQSIEFTEMDRFLGGGQEGKSATKAKIAPTPAAIVASGAKTASASPGPATGAMASGAPQDAKKPGEAEKPSMIELRLYDNRLVLTADFAQIVIIVNFM